MIFDPNDKPLSEAVLETYQKCYKSKLIDTEYKEQLQKLKKEEEEWYGRT